MYIDNLLGLADTSHQAQVGEIGLSIELGVDVQIMHVLLNERDFVIRVLRDVGAVAGNGVVEFVVNHSLQFFFDINAFFSLKIINFLAKSGHGYTVTFGFFCFLISLLPLFFSFDIVMSYPSYKHLRYVRLSLSIHFLTSFVAPKPV